MNLDQVRKDLGLITGAAMLAGLKTPALDGGRADVTRACEDWRG
jgi:hypothetical protein